MFSSLLDTLLDRSVLPGYSRLGYQLRRHLGAGGELPDMHGRRVLLTGASSGLGLAAAETMAGLGAEVTLVVRDRRRGERARSAVAARSGSERVELAVCDLSELASVRDFAKSVVASGQPLDVLVNNAGVLPDERKLSPDGIELTFATNVLGPFLLTNLLGGPLAGAAGRVINVCSGGMYTQRLHVEDLQMQREPFDGAVAYARSKRALVILSELWAERFAPAGVAVHAMHPGWADTPGLQESLPGFYRLTRPLLRTAAEGAETIVWLAGAPAGELGTGGFWHDRRRRPTHRVPWTHETAADRERLWSECARLSGWQEGAKSS